MRLAPVIDHADGARFISQFYAEIDAGSSDILCFPDSEAVLFIRSGTGSVTIASPGSFQWLPESGILRAPWARAFRQQPAVGDTIRLLLTACPQAPAPTSLASMAANFDESVPQRVGGVDAALREPMADRFYQILVGERPEESQITEFIGEIPLSRAAAHRHLYEEAIMVLCRRGLSGGPRSARAAVAPGDILSSSSQGFAFARMWHIGRRLAAGGRVP